MAHNKIDYMYLFTELQHIVYATKHFIHSLLIGFIIASMQLIRLYCFLNIFTC